MSSFLKVKFHCLQCMVIDAGAVTEVGLTQTLNFKWKVHITPTRHRNDFGPFASPLFFAFQIDK
jgi:hypothetical protein